MDNNLSKLKKEAQKIRLSESEKSAMRARIFGLPAQAGAPAAFVPSPYVFSSFFSFRMAASFAMVLLLVVGSTSAYAAQGSLPGDALYAIKTRVNEPVAGALAFSSEAKANHYAALAERRMEEAEVLAANGKLDASTAKNLESRLALHVEAADELTNKLSEEDPGTAAEVTARFASSLSAHSEILELLGDDSEDGDTKDNSGKLAMYVRENVTLNARWGGRNAAIAVSLKVGQAANADSMLFTAEAPTSSNEATSLATTAEPAEAMRATSSEASGEENEADQKSAEQVRRKSKEAYDEVRGVYSDARRNLSAQTTAEIDVKLTAIEDYIEIGELLLQEEKYDDAQDEFTNAIEESVRLKALIKAGKKFNKNLLEDLLWGKEEEERGEEAGKEQKGGIIPGIEVQIGL